MLFIMEGIDLAGVVDSDFQGIQINFAPPRPAGFANFRWAGQDLLFCGAGQPFFRGAGRTSLILSLSLIFWIFVICKCLPNNRTLLLVDVPS